MEAWATRPGRQSPKNCRGHGGRHAASSSSTRVPRASTLHHRASWGPELAQCGRGTCCPVHVETPRVSPLSFSTSGNPLVAGRGIAVGAHSATPGQDPACSSVRGSYSQSPLLCVYCPTAWTGRTTTKEGHDSVRSGHGALTFWLKGQTDSASN